MLRATSLCNASDLAFAHQDGAKAEGHENGTVWQRWPRRRGGRPRQGNAFVSTGEAPGFVTFRNPCPPLSLNKTNITWRGYTSTGAHTHTGTFTHTHLSLNITSRDMKGLHFYWSTHTYSLTYSHTHLSLNILSRDMKPNWRHRTQNLGINKKKSVLSDAILKSPIAEISWSHIQ